MGYKLQWAKLDGGYFEIGRYPYHDAPDPMTAAIYPSSVERWSSVHGKPNRTEVWFKTGDEPWLVAMSYAEFQEMMSEAFIPPEAMTL